MRQMSNNTLSAVLLLLLLPLASSQADDQLLWKYRWPSGLSGRLTADSGTLYGSSYDGGIFALDESSGSLLWRSRLPARCGDPVVSEDLLVYGCSNRQAYGINRTTGNRTWVEIYPDEFSSNAVSSGGLVYFGSRRGQVYAVKSANGRTLWKANAGAGIYSTPEPAEDMLYVPTAGAGLKAFRLKDGSAAWNFTQAGSVSSSPTAFRGNVYFGTDMGVLYALDRNTGEKKWSFQTGYPISAKPLVTRDIIVFSSSNGVIWGLNPDGSLKWTHNLTRFSNPEPVLYRGRIFAPDGSSRLLILDPESGSLLENRSYDSHFNNPPLFSSGRMIVGYLNGEVRVFGGSSDVRIDSIVTESHIYMGENAGYNVSVTNDGGLIIDSVNVSLRIDGRVVSSKNLRMSPHSSQSASFNASLPPGRHIVEAAAQIPATIDDAEPGNNRASAVFRVGDFWPLLKHEEQRTAAPFSVDDFANPANDVTWQCMFANNTYPQLYSPVFAAQLLGETSRFGDMTPIFSCYGYSEILIGLRANLSCRVANASKYALENQELLRKIGNLSSGAFESPEDYNLTLACSVRSNDRLPFDNATFQWNCLRNRWGSSLDARSLWFCNGAVRSSFSMESYSKLKGAKTLSSPLLQVAPRDYGLVWSFNAGSPVYSSAVTADLDQSGDGMLETVFASLDGTVYALRYDGSVLWKYGNPSTIHSTPALADLEGKGSFDVFFGDDAGIMHALNSQGMQEWEYQTGGPIMTSPLPLYFGQTHGRGIVFGSDDHTLYFLKADGTLLWNYTVQDKIQSSAASGNIVGDGTTQVVFGSNDNQLHAVSLPPYQHWYYQTNGDVLGTPAVYNSSGSSKIALTSQDGIFYDAYYAVKSYELSKRRCIGMDCGSDMIPLTGMDSNWAFSCAKPLESSPLVFDPYGNGSLYLSFGSDDGSLYIVDETGRKLIRYSANRNVRSSPSALSLDGKTYGVVFGDDTGRIFLIDMNGSAKWTASANGPIRSNPAVSDINGDTVQETIITSLDGSIYAYGLSPGAYNGTRPATWTPTTTTSTTSTTQAVPTTSTTLAAASTTSTTPTSTSSTTTSSTTSSSTTTSSTTSTTTSSTTTSSITSTTSSSTTTSISITTSTTSTSSSAATATTSSTAYITASSTTSTSLPEYCEPGFLSGVSGRACVEGSALNNAVFIPSEDMDVSQVAVPNATGLELTVMDSLLTKMAYSGQDGVLNTTLRLKAGELYILRLRIGGGCASQPPSIRTITSAGTWFVQDMWCEKADSCPLAVTFYPAVCREPASSAKERPTTTTMPPAAEGDDVDILRYLAIMFLVFIIALITGLSYKMGRGGKNGKFKLKARMINY
ncbi:MAG: PQQ-binding-like beta-propeller repeat protein [Candidatus Altiarchaeota archaeon]